MPVVPPVGGRKSAGQLFDVDVAWPASPIPCPLFLKDGQLDPQVMRAARALAGLSVAVRERSLIG